MVAHWVKQLLLLHVFLLRVLFPKKGKKGKKDFTKNLFLMFPNESLNFSITFVAYSSYISLRGSFLSSGILTKERKNKEKEKE